MSSVKLGDLLMALDFVSSGGLYDRSAYISRSTGETHWVSDALDEEEVPEDLDDEERYIEIPHKNELDLGKRSVLRFADRELPDSYDEVERIFSRKGAYSRYKALLERKGKLERWYEYEEAATLSALREWMEEVGMDLVEKEDK